MNLRVRFHVARQQGSARGGGPSPTICEAAQLASSPIERSAGLEAYTPDLRRQQGVEHTRAETYLLMTPREQPCRVTHSTGQSHMINASRNDKPKSAAAPPYTEERPELPRAEDSRFTGDGP